MPEELCKWCDVNEHKGKQLQDYEYKMCHKDESYRYSFLVNCLLVSLHVVLTALGLVLACIVT